MTASPSPISTPGSFVVPGAVRRNIPRPMTSFVGRAEDVTAVARLLARDDVRIVTITAPGGMGKTRVAIEVATAVATRFQDGIWFIPLAAIRDPALVPAVIAQGVDIPDSGRQPLLDRLRDALHSRRALLILDNLEHLPGIDIIVANILGHCPSLTVLGTSRKRLGISGEHVFPLRPLDPGAALDLFAQRATAIAPDFRLTTVLAPVVTEVCQRLDGLPLAIELAAARLPVLRPDALLARLDHRLSILAEGPHDAPERHHGLRESIDWSYSLLAGDEQRLFRRLGAFNGSFTLDAAAQVANDGHDALDGISSLESGSLLTLLPATGGEPRFTMLETIREFAVERLLESGEAAAIHQGHARFYMALADDTERVWWHSGGLDKLDELEPEIPNIRAALTWLQQHGDVPGLLGMAGSLAPMWAARGYSQEGRTWLEWGLPLSDGTRTPSLTVALRALSWILNQYGEKYRSLVIAQHALALAEADGDARNRVASLMLSGIAANKLGHPDLARNWYELAMEVLDRHAGEQWAPVSQCISMNLLAGLLIDQGEIDEAEMWYLRMRATQQSRGLRFTHAGHALRGLGTVALARGEPELALDHFLSAFQDARDVRDVRQIASCLGAMAGALSAMGHFDAAGRLFGASEAHHERIAFPFASETFAVQRALGLPEPWASMYPDCTEADGLRRTLLERTAGKRSVSLDANLAQTWWNEGRELDLDKAVALVPARPPVTLPARATPDGLSSREREVLALLVLGKTDQEIGSLLYISRRTASTHVRHIYDKINVTSRAAATAYALRHGLA